MPQCAALCNVRSAYKTVSMQASGEEKSGVDRVTAERDFPVVVRDTYRKDFLPLNRPRIM